MINHVRILKVYTIKDENCVKYEFGTKGMNKLSIDEVGCIGKYLLNEDFYKLKLYFCDKDYIYLDWLRIRVQEEYFKSKIGMNIEDLCHQKIIKKQLQIEYIERMERIPRWMSKYSAEDIR